MVTTTHLTDRDKTCHNRFNKDMHDLYGSHTTMHMKEEEKEEEESSSSSRREEEENG